MSPRRIVSLLASCMVVILSPKHALSQSPCSGDVIDLPIGFFPEGFAIGKGTTFYAGSLGQGSIYRGDLKTGNGTVWVDPPSGGPEFGVTAGLSVDSRNRVWVAGGRSGQGRVYDGETGELLGTYNFSQPSAVNDVIATNEAVFFTDSGTQTGQGLPGMPRVFVVNLGPNGTLPSPGCSTRTVSVSSPGISLDYGTINFNGIETSPSNPNELIVCHTTLGLLFSVVIETGMAQPVANVTICDGLFRRDNTVYVVQNPLRTIAAVEFPLNESRGVITNRYNVTGAETPSTMGLYEDAAYVVDARFGVQSPLNETSYHVYCVDLDASLEIWM